MMLSAALQPSDVIVLRSTSWFAKAIEIGSVLRGLPSASHVAVIHHRDSNGTLWALEGRPGGVGWRDAATYARDPRAVTNILQPRTDAQRAAICTTCEAMIGTAYDWASIVEDAGIAFGLKDIWATKIDGQLPGHCVCSSLAAYAYMKAGVPCPRDEVEGDWRHLFPADWASWIQAEAWKVPAAA